MTIDQIFERIARDSDGHVMADPSQEEDLRELERRIEFGLPLDFRAFLKRFGGGFFYQRHEIFGPRNIMIHDIELVQDLLSVRRRFMAKTAQQIPNYLLIFHQDISGVSHAMDLRQTDPEIQPTFSSRGSITYPNFTAFLASILPVT